MTKERQLKSLQKNTWKNLDKETFTKHVMATNKYFMFAIFLPFIAFIPGVVLLAIGCTQTEKLNLALGIMLIVAAVISWWLPVSTNISLNKRMTIGLIKLIQEKQIDVYGKDEEFYLDVFNLCPIVTHRELALHKLVFDDEMEYKKLLELAHDSSLVSFFGKRGDILAPAKLFYRSRKFNKKYGSK